MKKTILILSYFLICCRTQKNNLKSFEYYKEFPAIQVSFFELIHNKAKYHKKLVEVEGYYEYGFEISRLKFDTLAFDFSKSNDYLLYLSNLWIELHPSYQSPLNWRADKIQREHLKVKGIYDTTKHGHMEDNFAEIDSAFLVFNPIR